METKMQKKGKNGKKKAHLFGFFRFYIPCAFFLHFKPKNSYKKDKNAKKKQKKNFQIAKIHMQKKAENNISKKHAKKKLQKKQGGCKCIKRANLVLLLLKTFPICFCTPFFNTKNFRFVSIFLRATFFWRKKSKNWGAMNHDRTLTVD